jgi:hypothetical protein
MYPVGGGQYLGMLRRRSEAEFDVTNFIPTRSPVASSRTFDRSVARRCIMLVILRLARA